MTLTINSKVGEWVALNSDYAAVFDKNKIDFCCGGGVSLAEVCKAKGIDIETLLAELDEIKISSNVTQLDQLELTELVDYVQREFHEEIRVQIPKIQSYLDKVIAAHGENHKELFQVKELIDEGFNDLLHHMEKEEEVLFPLVKGLMRDPKDDFILRPIAVMECEHDNEGDRYRKIAKLTNNYGVPEDTCNSYRYLFELLKKFEQRLHLHIHTENNILFPKIKNIFQN